MKRLKQSDRGFAPEFVDTKAKEMVQEVISVADVVEHLRHLFLFARIFFLIGYDRHPNFTENPARR
jgi:hypothetical protein